MYIENGTTSMTVNYSPDAENCIEKLKYIFNDEEAKTKYWITNWTEWLASIHFLKKKEMNQLIRCFEKRVYEGEEILCINEKGIAGF